MRLLCIMQEGVVLYMYSIHNMILKCYKVLQSLTLYGQSLDNVRLDGNGRITIKYFAIIQARDATLKFYLFQLGHGQTSNFKFRLAVR